jgi:hypothetical protein
VRGDLAKLSSTLLLDFERTQNRTPAIEAYVTSSERFLERVSELEAALLNLKKEYDEMEWKCLNLSMTRNAESLRSLLRHHFGKRRDWSRSWEIQHKLFELDRNQWRFKVSPHEADLFTRDLA